MPTDQRAYQVSPVETKDDADDDVERVELPTLRAAGGDAPGDAPATPTAARKARLTEARQMLDFRAEVDGVRLHLSAEAASGYMGVTKHGSGFRARSRAGFGSGFRDLGTFTTAVEAAKAYALYVLQRQAVPAAAALPIPTATGPQIEDVDD